MALWATLDAGERSRLEDLVRLVLADVDVEASRGFEVDDLHRVVVAAHAGLLVLGLDVDHLRRVRSVVVHPRTVRLAGQRATDVRGVVTEGSGPLHGQASIGGPVILSWQAALRGSQRPWTGHNVVLHEFAHALDMGDGAADGTPRLGDSAVGSDEYRSVLQSHLDRLRRGGRDPVLRPYAATNPAEFLAVATEVFFGRPRGLRDTHPDLYEVLVGTYNQDPASRPPVEPEPAATDDDTPRALNVSWVYRTARSAADA